MPRIVHNGTEKTTVSTVVVSRNIKYNHLQSGECNIGKFFPLNKYNNCWRILEVRTHAETCEENRCMHIAVKNMQQHAMRTDGCILQLRTHAA